ncbi:hypothetical protein ACFL1S_00725 [Pseudomonadota bacterium]
MTRYNETALPGRMFRWVDNNILSLGRDMRISYLPPLMVYIAAGVSGLTGIVGTFFVKDYLGLSASFLAALGFWAGIPWALKMPVGHLVDLFWKWKSALVFLGAGLIASSLGIMVGLIEHTDAMRQVMSVEAWFVLSTLLAPVGYVVQDVVADAMTVEAVPRFDDNGNEIDGTNLRLMHTTMQTLGRVAIIGGAVLVAVINISVFTGAGELIDASAAPLYARIYMMAMIIPVISVSGVSLGEFLKHRQRKQLRTQGMSEDNVRRIVDVQEQAPAANWWILGGSLGFVVFTLGMGLSDFPFSQEIIFAGSMAIIIFLITRITGALDRSARNVLVGTAVLVFVFRALPGPGAGATWFAIDELAFDQQFLSVLSLIGSTLTLLGMFIFRRFMAERSMAYIIGFLTLAGAFLSLPNIGLYYGVHEWTASMTDGVVDARFIALIDTALESPLGQIAMIPMLAWIASSAPAALKATFFAVMASFTNLALSARELGTKYLNQIFVVSREVQDSATGDIVVAADYSELGYLLITVMLIGLAVPFIVILLVRVSPLKSVGDG